MFRRIGLFLLTNFLVVITVSLILGVVMPMLGIQVEGTIGLAVFCGVFGMVGAFISLAISRWMAKRAYRIQLIDGQTQSSELREIFFMVSQMAGRAGLPVPEVGIYDSPEPNAFATGPSRNKSLIAFSTGLVRGLGREEIEAVVAHELSHIRNGDMVTMTLLTGIANALVMFVARLAAHALDQFLSDDDGGGGLGFFGYIMVVMLLESVLMMLAYIPIAAFSRWREFRADGGAAGLTSPNAMIHALERLQSVADAGRAPKRSESHTMALMKIQSRQRVSLWATHPSMEARIERLRHAGTV